MLLELDYKGAPMKLVYELSKALEKKPERVTLAQALTLDPSRPMMGLKGTCGLFGSKEWWLNISQKKMPLVFVSGIIRRTYFAGHDKPSQHNTVELLTREGSVVDVGIYVNDRNDVSLFKVGRGVKVVYALDELKKQPAPDGGVNYAETAIEMAVSLENDVGR